MSSQALLDEVTQPDLAGALEPGLAGLQRDVIGVGEAQLVDLLRRTTRSPPGTAVARQFSMVVFPAWVRPATSSKKAQRRPVLRLLQDWPWARRWLAI